MKVQELHSWRVSVAEAQDIQRRLAAQVSKRGEVGEPRFIAGADISAPGRSGVARGAVVVLTYPALEVVETSVVEESVSFPYVPGLLSFRESPLILAACARLSLKPDLLLVDGQGLAHPRRLGIASHLGLLLDMPTIGCAKSRLCGSHAPPGAEPGSYTDLVDGGEVVGVVLRTREGSPPLYISIGHKVDLTAAIKWVLRCCRGRRLPEPTRLAHLAAGGQLPAVKAPQTSRQASLF
jgi:deoxyribonuclease V